MRIALTGAPGSGKTSLCLRLAQILSGKLKLGGMISSELRESGIRMGFQILDLASGARGILAHVNQPQGPRIGKYRVNLEDLENIGVNAIINAVENCELVIIDELGPMELCSPKFIAAVEDAILKANKLLVTIHHTAQHPLLSKIRDQFQIFKLHPRNRDLILNQLLSKLG